MPPPLPATTALRIASLFILYLGVAGCATQPAAPTGPAAMPQSPAPAPTSTSPAADASTPGWLAPTTSPYGTVLEQTAAPPVWQDFQMSRVLSEEEKHRWQARVTPLLGQVAGLDPREALNPFAHKLKARAGLRFDEVVESMRLAANTHNLKFVGRNLLSEDFGAVLGLHDAPRVELYSFCDSRTAYDLLRQVPEMVVFLPCRVAVMEDADRAVWLLTLDWDALGLERAGLTSGFTPALRAGIADIKRKLYAIMQAGAEGAL